MANQYFKWSPQALKKLGVSTALITTAALSGCSLIENFQNDSVSSVVTEDESAESSSAAVVEETTSEDSVATVPDADTNAPDSFPGDRPAPPDGGPGGPGGRGGHDHHDQELSEDAYNPDELIAVDPTTTTTEQSSTNSSTVTYADSFQDGQYVGDSVTADRWGNMQVVAVIEDGELTQVLIADYPRSTDLSDVITRNALPSLISDAIEAQDADGIDIVSGATDSSRAFIESLDSALEDALILDDGATS